MHIETFNNYPSSLGKKDEYVKKNNYVSNSSVILIMPYAVYVTENKLASRFNIFFKQDEEFIYSFGKLESSYK